MLLNMVRLKYREKASFLEISSITVSPRIQTSAAFDTEIDIGPGGNIIKPGIGVEYSQSPTISYTPLRGEDFLKSVLSSISLEAILVMTQSGWSIERVFGITMERMNDLYNAPSASGPTPSQEPKRYENFARALELFRQFQREGLMEIGSKLEMDKKKGADDNSRELVILFVPDERFESEGKELQSLLGITAKDYKVFISTNFLDRNPNTLNVRVRSMMSVLFYLSQNIKVPDEHKEAGLVTVTRSTDGDEFNWDETLSEQMLLNMVRLKYREKASFLEISSITVSPRIQTSAAFDTEIDIGPGGNIIKPGIGVEYSQSPTISYTPLRGEDFLKSVLSSISLEAILVMTQSGWSIERVFGITMERMNDLYNAPSASGPTPSQEPKRYENFARALELFRQFQREGLMEIGSKLEMDKKKGADDNSRELVILFVPDERFESEGKELQSLLGISADDHKVFISTNFLDKSPHTLNVRVRSMMSVLFYLSQNIKVPDEHKEAGLVTVTRTVDGDEFNWDETPGGRHFTIYSSKERPVNAYIAVSSQLNPLLKH